MKQQSVMLYPYQIQCYLQQKKALIQIMASITLIVKRGY